MKIRLLLIAGLLPLVVFAQAPRQLTSTFDGLTQNVGAIPPVNRGQIVKMTASGQVAVVATTDTSGAYGVATTSATGGNIIVSVDGSPLVQVDGVCVVGNIVSISSVTAGLGHCAATASGQSIGVAVTSSPAAGFVNVQLSALSSSGAGGGVSSPSSLTTFYNKYYGLAPQDFGAKSDTKFCYDGNVSGQPTTTFTSTACAQFSSATDIGKVIEIQGAGAAGAVLHTTIFSVTNATTVVLAASATTNVTNVKFLYGTNDNSAVQAWVSAIISNPKTQVRAGYVPAGLYYITQPMRFVNPFGTQGPGITECGPTSSGTGNIQCGIQIVGAAASSSEFIIATAGSFNWGSNSQTAAMFFQGWQFAMLENVALLADTSSHNTTAYTQGTVCGLMFFGGAHANFQQNWVQGFRNTTHDMGGFCDDSNDFESYYAFNAFEANDINAWLGQAGNVGGTFEKITFDNNFMEVPGSVLSAQPANMKIGSATGIGSMAVKEFRARNINLFNSVGQPDVLILGSVAVPAGETMVFDSPRFQPINPPSTGFTINSGTTGIIELNNPSWNPFNVGTYGLDNLASGTTVNLFGGTMGTSNINNVGTVYLYGTSGVGTISGAGGTFGFLPTATGWTGGGVNQGTSWVSNQGIAFGTSNVGLTTGWGTSTVTAASGFNQHFRFTISVTGVPGASPTITVTLPNVLPSSTVLCSLNEVGGSAGFFTAQQTTASATAPIFTVNGTPVAATTQIWEGICGP